MSDARRNSPEASAARSILNLLRAVRATGLPLNILFLPATITALVCGSCMAFRASILFGGDSFPYEILASHVRAPPRPRLAFFISRPQLRRCDLHLSRAASSTWVTFARFDRVPAHCPTHMRLVLFV